MMKTIRAGCLIGLLCLVLTFSATAMPYTTDQPYDSYVYSSDHTPLAISAPYTVEKTVTGHAVGVGAFSGISDLFYDKNGHIFLCDTGNNRVIITDDRFSLIATVTSFADKDGNAAALNAPQGVFADGKYIYIADTGNGRIVVLDAHSLACIRILEKPDISILEAGYTYAPKALTVDNTGRLYVIADGINQGIICLNEAGQFETFLGAPDVEPNLFEQLWRSIATDEQRAQMQSYIPTEYNSILMDDRGFLYVTSESSKTVHVARLNANGENVLTSLKEKLEYGDSNYTRKHGAQQQPYFSDVTVLQDGTYFVLDSRQNKIYGYSSDGYLLYVFGASGSQSGTFQTAGAITTVGDSLIVTDSSKNTVTVLSQTAFGASVTEALTLYREGLYNEAKTALEKVENYVSNYPLAEILLAKIDMQNGDFTTAMRRLDNVGEEDLYAKAFVKARDLFIRRNFVWLLIVAAALIIILIVAAKLLKKTTAVQAVFRSDLWQKYRYGSYVMVHPFDGFWDIKREKRGNLTASLITTVLFFLVYSIRMQVEEENVLYKDLMLFLPLCFYVIASWCFTTLMDGEGSFKDTVIATGYALKPYVLFGIPVLLLSVISGAQTASFAAFLDKVLIIWMLLLLVIGLMITQDYSVSKTVVTVILTLIGICIIIFILLLFINVLQEVVQFFYNIVRELSFRTY